MGHLTGPARAAIVGHVLCRLVLDDIPVGLFVHQLNARAHLAGMRGRLAGCADVLPGGSRVHLGCLHRHRDRTLLHANVSPVWMSGKGMYIFDKYIFFNDPKVKLKTRDN